MLFRQYDLNQTSKVEVDFGSNTERQYWSGSFYFSWCTGAGGGVTHDTHGTHARLRMRMRARARRQAGRQAGRQA